MMQNYKRIIITKISIRLLIYPNRTPILRIDKKLWNHYSFFKNKKALKMRIFNFFREKTYKNQLKNLKNTKKNLMIE
jgi:hypothetical protein